MFKINDKVYVKCLLNTYNEYSLDPHNEMLYCFIMKSIGYIQCIGPNCIRLDTGWSYYPNDITINPEDIDFTCLKDIEPDLYAFCKFTGII